MAGRDRRQREQPREPPVRVALERPVADRREPRRDQPQPVVTEVDQQRQQRPDVEHDARTRATSRNGSSQPNRSGTRIRWPDQEIGRNSVSPARSPSRAPGGCVHRRSSGGRIAVPPPGRAPGLPDEERGEDERDRREQLDEDVERRAGGVLERVADGVADDRRGVGLRALAEHVALVVLEVARLDVLLGVVPRAAAVVEDGGEQDAAMVPTISMPATASKPSRRPMTIGVATATTPGKTISRRAARVVMSTTRA